MSREVWTDAEVDVLIYAAAATGGGFCILLSVFTPWWWALLLPVFCAAQAIGAWRRVFSDKPAHASSPAE